MIQEVNQSHSIGSSATFVIDNIATEICIYVLYTVLCQIINIFGIVTNTINIACFLKQGFKDSINVSLLGLSISDLASLITTAYACISFTPAYVAADLPFESIDVAYLVTGMPHLVFTRVSSCITAMITLERCLSVVTPFKVNDIITPKRAAVIIVCMFIISTFSVTPIYVVNRLTATFSDLKNKTIIKLVFREDKLQVEMITFAINNFFIPLCAFVIVAICTVVLSTHLRKQLEWRNTTINDAHADRISNRNLKVAKMVVAISTLFIACFVPFAIFMLAVAFEPELSLNGKYMNVSLIILGFVCILESINFSANIFIYRRMSTKYRDALRVLFNGGRKRTGTFNRIAPHTAHDLVLPTK